MSYDVTSWFQQQAELKISSPVRKFTMQGDDLVKDNGFDISSDWAAGGATDWEVSGGVAVHSGGGSYSDISPAGENEFTMVLGDSYLLSLQVNSLVGRVQLNDAGAGYPTIADTVGQKTISFIPVTNDKPYIYNTSYDGIANIDNLYVSKINEDYSDRVLVWPSFGVEWNNIRPVRVSLNLANEDQAMNFLRTDRTSLQNSCTLQMGFTKYGKANFPAPRSNITMPDSGGLGTLTDSNCTYEAWVTPTSDSITYDGFFLARSGFHTGLIFTPERKFRYMSWDNTDALDGSVIDSTSRTLGQTYHVMGRQDVVNGWVDLTIDGVMISSDALGGNDRRNFTTNYFIGGVGSYQLFGDVHESRLYNRAISDAESIEHYNGVYIDESNLQGHWGLNEIDQSSVSDLSVNGHHGLLVNSTTIVEDSLKLGTGDNELLDMFHGNLDTISMVDGTITLDMADKFRVLAERVMGSSNSAIDYTSSEYLVSDLAWWMCTSHGGLSAIESSSNPDINFDTFDTWAGVMSGDNVRMSGRFSGMRVLEALRKVSRSTFTAIFQEEDKIRFHRFNLADSGNTALTNNELMSTRVDIDGKKIVNKKYVMLNFDTTSRYHQQTIIEQDSASVNSYGPREATEKDASLWFVSSQGGINAAQRDILVHKIPYDAVVAKVPLIGMLRSVGEMISVTEGHIGLSGETFRIMKRSLSMQTGLVTFNADASQLFGGFVLDTSSLDGADVLT